jgi:hypothetical protein
MISNPARPGTESFKPKPARVRVRWSKAAAASTAGRAADRHRRALSLLLWQGSGQSYRTVLARFSVNLALRALRRKPENPALGGRLTNRRTITPYVNEFVK